MKKFFSKALAFAPLALAGVTVSWTNLTLEAADITTMGNGITGMATSLLGIFIDLVPYLLLFAVVFMAIGMISKYLKIRGAKGGRRR